MINRPQLFMLHFAGGNCYSFRFLATLLKDFEVITPELPGRGKRMDEPLLNNFDQAALDLYGQLVKRLKPVPFLIYGHSMGAYLALRVAGMLEKVGWPPSYLIVSGNAGPGAGDSSKKRYLMKGGAFISELKALGGIPEELLDDEEVFRFFEPVIRADFEIAEENNMQQEPAINTPLYAIMGSQEEAVEQLSNWGRFTKAHFSYEILEGNHFFIYKHPQRLADIIRHCHKTGTFPTGKQIQQL